MFNGAYDKATHHVMNAIGMAIEGSLKAINAPTVKAKTLKP